LATQSPHSHERQAKQGNRQTTIGHCSSVTIEHCSQRDVIHGEVVSKAFDVQVYQTTGLVSRSHKVCGELLPNPITRGCYGTKGVAAKAELQVSGRSRINVHYPSTELVRASSS